MLLLIILLFNIFICIEYGSWFAAVVERSLGICRPTQSDIVGWFPVVVNFRFPIEDTLAGRDCLAAIHHLLHHWRSLLRTPPHTDFRDDDVLAIHGRKSLDVRETVLCITLPVIILRIKRQSNDIPLSAIFFQLIVKPGKSTEVLSFIYMNDDLCIRINFLYSIITGVDISSKVGCILRYLTGYTTRSALPQIGLPSA